MTTLQVSLNREILAVLYAGNSFWSRCGGSESRKGMTSTQLLNALIERFPETAWHEELLSILLRTGVKSGIFKTRQINLATCAVNVEVPPLPDPTPYYANDAMVIERCTNKIYADLAPRHICIPQCHRIIAPIV